MCILLCPKMTYFAFIHWGPLYFEGLNWLTTGLRKALDSVDLSIMKRVLSLQNVLANILTAELQENKMICII